MSYVITSVCLGCKCGKCAEMCPHDAVHEGAMMLFIDPDECTSCGACAWHCERNAIVPQDELPEPLSEWKQINAQMAPKLPTVRGQQEPIGFPQWHLEN